VPKTGLRSSNFSFNFDSAAGIIYTVDVTRPKGEKVTIVSLADGSPFRMDHIYKVALNYYRGNGGGELLTKGSGISQEKLKERIIFSTDKDLRSTSYCSIYVEGKVTDVRIRPSADVGTKLGKRLS